MHRNSPMFYFDQEKVLIRRCPVNNTAIRAVSRIEEPFLGRLSDSAEGPLGRRLFGSPFTTRIAGYPFTASTGRSASGFQRRLMVAMTAAASNPPRPPFIAIA